jgi:hypothetical protein
LLTTIGCKQFSSKIYLLSIVTRLVQFSIEKKDEGFPEIIQVIVPDQQVTIWVGEEEQFNSVFNEDCRQPMATSGFP